MPPNTSPYIIENGFRHVKPYFYKFTTTVKERWKNKTISAVLTSELGQSPEAVDHGIDEGTVFVSTNTNRVKDTKKLSPEETRIHKLRDHDMLHNEQHFHEPPILYSGPVPIIMENDNIVVVSKPSGMPTHPSGSYRLNSLTHILKEEQGWPILSPCHRLDKATSGLLVLAKNAEATKAFQVAFNDKKNTEKWYLARVKGKFPSEKFVFEFPVFSLNFGGYINNRNAANVPVKSITEFELLRYSKELNESIVSCKAITGKMHQIRIHLRTLGHPIVNDFIYNPGPQHPASLVKNQIELEIYDEVKKRISPNDANLDLKSLISSMPGVEDRILQLKEIRRKAEKKSFHGECPECHRKLWGVHEDEDIYLHAYRLKHDGEIKFDLKTDMPSWANI